MSWRARATYLEYRVAAALAIVLPWPVIERLIDVAARLGPRLFAAGSRIVARNLARAGHPATDDEVRGTFRSYARYWVELFRLPAEVRRDHIDAHFSIEGLEEIEKALEAGNGAILALPHLGGWEWAAAWMAGRGYRMVAVVETLEPPELFQWFMRQREAYGLEIAPLGPGVSTTLLRALGENRLLCLVSDRDLTGDGVEVEFFGERTTLPGGPATLALRTGATLLPAAVYFAPGRNHHAVVRPPVPTPRTGRLKDDVVRITQDLAHEFEHLIRAAPEQWHLLQPNWPSDREPT